MLQQEQGEIKEGKKKGECRKGINLSELDLVAELVEAVVEAAEAVDVLLVLPRHLRLRAIPLRTSPPAT